jgi:hypothetical protein
MGKITEALKEIEDTFKEVKKHHNEALFNNIRRCYEVPNGVGSFHCPINTLIYTGILESCDHCESCGFMGTLKGGGGGMLSIMERLV